MRIFAPFQLVSILGLFVYLPTSASALESCEKAEQHSPKPPAAVAKEQNLEPTIGSEAYTSYQAVSTALNTRKGYHGIVLHPAKSLEGAALPEPPELTVEAPIFLVAFEKPRGPLKLSPHVSPKECIGDGMKFGSVNVITHGVDEAKAEKRRAKVQKSLCQIADDARPLMLTHVVEIEGVQNGRYGPSCFVSNAYHSDGRCSADSDRVITAASTPQQIEQFQVDGLKALELRIDAALESQAITDIVLLSTGWNTTQMETLYNTLDWMRVIKASRSSSRPYRPLYITVSWESRWNVSVLSKWNLSVLTKGNDADELGLVWVNRLLNDVLIPDAAQRGIPITLVGHSYGTRVLGTALYLRDAIVHPPAPLPMPTIAFVGLQPAFPLNRYGYSKGLEPMYAVPPPPALVVFTASEHDAATSLLHFGPYLGGGRAVKRLSDVSDAGMQNLKAFSSVGDRRVLDVADAETMFSPYHLDYPGLYLVDAKNFVSCNMPNTGGGAHSDVFDEDAGRLIAQVMELAQKSKNLPGQENSKYPTEHVDAKR